MLVVIYSGVQITRAISAISLLCEITTVRNECVAVESAVYILPLVHLLFCLQSRW